MRCRSFIIAALTALLVSLVVPVTAKADGCPPAVRPNAVGPGGFFTDPSVGADFNSGLLGPKPMPSGPVGRLIGLVLYQRFGTTPDGKPMSASDFVHTFYRDTKDASKWNWPDHDGFADTPQDQTLTAGTLIDRFGNPTGQFLADPKTPYAARGLPPSNLTSYGGTPVANYHVYCVVTQLKVKSGKIAPGFGQKGGGTQYFIPNISPDVRDNIQNHLDNHDLVEVVPT
jgi:hypothetical protein